MSHNTVHLLLLFLSSIITIESYEFKCPTDWISYGTDCYQFIRSPAKNYEEAREACSRYNAFLLSVISLEEHNFITEWLRQNDPIHSSWYTSAIDTGSNSWRWAVPIHGANSFDPIGSVAHSSSGGVSHEFSAGNSGRSSQSDFYSILASLWLPTSVTNTNKNRPQSNLYDSSRPTSIQQQQTLIDGSIWDRNAKNAVYNFSKSHNRWGLIRVNGMEYHNYVCKLRRQNVNFATAMERNIDYGYNTFDTNKIPRGPRFIYDPESVVFDVSGRAQLNYATLKCVAEGFPTPTYKWYKQDYVGATVHDKLIDPLSDRRYTQTDGILTIDNPQADKDRGKYHCTAENQYGIIISKTVQLSFGYIGEFTKKRSPEFGREFWGRSISCDPPKHHPSVNYHWSRDSFEYIVEDDRRIFVSRDGNLYFSSLEKIDRANYSCNVKSSIASSGRTGPFFPLIVDSASNSQNLLFPNHFPKIFPDYKLAGTEIRLECMAYGYPVPYYNWSRTGITDRMPAGSYLTSYARVLIIPSAKVEDSGEYTCTATSGKDFISKSVALLIQSLPVILREIGNKVVERDLPALQWECEAFGIPAVTYTWYKNGIEISDYNKATIFSEEDRNRLEVRSNILIIHGLIPERDEGMYQCKATNEFGTAFSSGQLRIVQMAPSLRKHPMPSELFAGEGANITIPCVPEALPAPTFEWQKDYNRISAMGGRIRILPNGFLHISPVHRTDEGTYTCIARNNLGHDRTHGRLRVFPRPKMYIRPNPVYERQIGDTIELPCMAATEGTLDVAYVWQHNGIRIVTDQTKSSGSESMMSTNQFSMSGLDGDLRITNLTLAETGDYECIVETNVGSISASTKIVLYAQPGAPGAVVCDDITATSARLHWSDGSDNGRRITSYRIEGHTNHDNRWQVILNSSEYENRFETIRENGRKLVYLNNILSPWSTYQFRVAAINEIGMGPYSEPSPSYNTDKSVPFKAPSNVNGGGGKVGTLMIMWDPLPPKDWNAPDIWYRVYYKAEDMIDHPYIDHNLTSQGNINMFAVNVGDENYYKRYLVRVQAMNSMGAGRTISDPVVVYSAESMPQIAPTGVYATAHNSTAMNVTWTPLDSNREKLRGKLIGHRIKYWKLSQNPQFDALTLLRRDPEQSWGLIVGLFPDTEYYIAVMGYNEAGAGPESEPFLARTYKAAPQQQPTSVNVTAINARSVMVKWRGISSLTAAEEPIIGYKVRYWEQDQPITRATEVYKYLDGGDLQAIISDLIPGKVYKLRVLAFSNGGDGKMSSQIEFKVGDGVKSNVQPLSSASTSFASFTSATAIARPTIYHTRLVALFDSIIFYLFLTYIL